MSHNLTKHQKTIFVELTRARYPNVICDVNVKLSGCYGVHNLTIRQSNKIDWTSYDSMMHHHEKAVKLSFAQIELRHDAEPGYSGLLSRLQSMANRIVAAKFKPSDQSVHSQLKGTFFFNFGFNVVNFQKEKKIFSLITLVCTMQDVPLSYPGLVIYLECDPFKVDDYHASNRGCCFARSQPHLYR